MTTTQGPAASPRLDDNGYWRITCRGAIHRKGKAHDVVLEWRRRDGIWDREAVAFTPTLISSLHEFTIAEQTPCTLAAKGRIDPDPWAVIGGPMRLEIELPWQAQSTGRFRGSFGEETIAGEAAGVYEAEYPHALGVSRQRPAILDAFERDGAAGRLYDYSWAGRGTVDPCPGLPVFEAVDFGVAPDSGREAGPAIQAALDAAGAAGGGVVHLPPGVIDLNVGTRLATLRIRHRVVLRGSGSGPDGTLLVNHRYHDSPEPDKPWLAGQWPVLHIGPDGDSEEPEPVADASGLAVGGAFLLRHLETDGSLARDLVQGRVDVAANWRGEGRELVSQLLTVVAIDGNRLTIDAPLHRDVGPWPVQLCRLPMIDRAGICDLRIRGLWDGFFVHHKNPEHDNGWDHVKFVRVRAGWASNLVHENTTSALGLSDCLGCVVRDCRIRGNPGHNGFVLNRRSTGNLFVGCHAGRNMHGFNVQGTLSGNAVVDCTMDEPSGIDLHGGIGCDNLFDGIVGGVLKGGGSANAVPPRHGPGMTLWNWACGFYDPYKPWQRQTNYADHDTTPGFIAVGVHSAYGRRLTVAGPDGRTDAPVREPWGWVESPGQRVSPRSLYAWQCARRVV